MNEENDVVPTSLAELFPFYGKDCRFAPDIVFVEEIEEIRIANDQVIVHFTGQFQFSLPRES